MFGKGKNGPSLKKKIRKYSKLSIVTDKLKNMNIEK